MFKSRSLCALALVPLLVGCGGGGGGLSDPGLSNVQVEVGNARSAVIGPDGGTISATGSNGFVYTLTIPANSVFKPTEIAMYPIAAIKNLPAGGTISGGVNFAPDGLELFIPATLSIQVPGSIDARKAVPIAYSGNAENLHLDLGTVTGQTISTRIYHFSGTALGNRTITDLLLPNPQLTNTTTDFQRRLANAFWVSEQNNTSPLADYNLILRNWYDLIVKPKLTTGGQPGSTLRDINKGITEYTAWLDAILYAQRTLGDPAFNVQPQNSESEPLAITLLKRWYRFWNDGCVRNKNNALDDFSVAPGGEFVSPLFDASIALNAGDEADEWHIPRAANSLDKETLLNSLCVKVKIESKSYNGNVPGDSGDAKVTAGFTIDGGPIRHDATIRVKFGGNGSFLPGDVIIVNGATANKVVVWKQNVNPIIIDITASLKDFSNIAVFDRITKSASSGKLAFSSALDANFGIVVSDADGSHSVKVSGGTDDDRQPAISPDGTKIAFNRHRFPSDSIVVMNIDGSNPLSLTNNKDSNPTWSPDGKKIAFESHRDGTAAIYVMNADGSNQTRITFNGKNSFDGDFNPAWSPDGTKIAFATSTLEIHTVKPDGSNQQTLTTKTQDTAPAWSPDGKKIAFQSGRVTPTEIFAMNADGSNVKQLTNEARSCDYPSWSPDGTKIAFHSHPSVDIDGIFVISAAGGSPKLLVSQGRSREPSFSPKP